MFGGQIQAHQILHHAPKTARKIIAKLKAEYKVIEHTLTTGGKDYKLYTLGSAGAAAINMPYNSDYWIYYSDSETIQRLMAVDLYIHMCDYLSTDMKIYSAEKPYMYTFIHGDKTYKVGAIFDNELAYIEAYRWNPPRERIILVCQSISQVISLPDYLVEDTPIRAITREKLKEGLIFYRLENKKWVLDIPNKQIKPQT